MRKYKRRKKGGLGPPPSYPPPPPPPLKPLVKPFQKMSKVNSQNNITQKRSIGVVRSNLPPKRPHTFPRRRTRKPNFRHSTPPMTQHQKMMAINARAEDISRRNKPFKATEPTSPQALKRAEELRKARRNAEDERTRQSLQAKLDKQSWKCKYFGWGCAAGGRRRTRRRRRRRKRRRTKRRKRRRKRRTRRVSRR